jgi:hypothetical protein
MTELPVGEVFKLHQAGLHPYLDVRYVRASLVPVSHASSSPRTCARTPEEFVQGHASGAFNIPVMLRSGGGDTPACPVPCAASAGI